MKTTKITLDQLPQGLLNRVLNYFAAIENFPDKSTPPPDPGTPIKVRCIALGEDIEDYQAHIITEYWTKHRGYLSAKTLCGELIWMEDFSILRLPNDPDDVFAVMLGNNACPKCHGKLKEQHELASSLLEAMTANLPKPDANVRDES